MKIWVVFLTKRPHSMIWGNNRSSKYLIQIRIRIHYLITWYSRTTQSMPKTIQRVFVTSSSIKINPTLIIIAISRTFKTKSASTFRKSSKNKSTKMLNVSKEGSSKPQSSATTWEAHWSTTWISAVLLPLSKQVKRSSWTKTNQWRSRGRKAK